MKNPEGKALRLRRNGWYSGVSPEFDTRLERQEFLRNYGLVLSNLAIAESNLVKAGKDSALTHFIAIVKELENLYGFNFETMEDECQPPPA